jgi:probable phosphoglycerate mutase
VESGEIKMRLYFVRHGQSEANLTRTFSNFGWKHPLTQKGVEQAHTLAERLAREGITRIYSSPIQRAVQTAAILAAKIGSSFELSEALREFSVGIFEDSNDPKDWEAHDDVMADWFRCRKLESKIEGGESFLDIRTRFEPFIDQVVSQARGTDERVVLVGHGGLYITMLPAILKNIGVEYSLMDFFPNTGYVLAETRADGMYCLEWCGLMVEQGKT